MKKHTWKIVGVAAIVLLIGSFFYANQAAETANEGISFTPHVKGNPEAAVTLTEYSDFQCPACGQAFPVVQSILEQYGEDVRFEYKHFPLTTIHPHARAAARAAEAAGQQGEFFAMHDRLFENQSVWSNSSNPQQSFVRFAEDIGLDMDQFNRQKDASLIDEKVMSEFEEAQTRGFTGTPTFVLNGEQVEFSTYQELIELVGAAVETANPGASTSTATSSTETTFSL